MTSPYLSDVIEPKVFSHKVNYEEIFGYLDLLKLEFPDCQNDYLKIKRFQTYLLRGLFTFLYGCMNFVALALQQSHFVHGSISQVFQP